MYFALNFYPQFNTELAESIGAIRKKYDPTFGFTKPHITVLFPVPDKIGEPQLIRHIGDVLNDLSPFEIRFGGFQKSHDHWLFVTLTEGEEKIKKLYQMLYTGILAKYRKDDIEYVPHLGLGLFIKEGCIYDWDNVQDSDFDQKRYGAALQKAEALSLNDNYIVDKLHLVKIPEEILEWATGKRGNLPKNLHIVEVREFLLGNH